MAYNTNTPRAEYTASATQTVFPFLFKIFATSDVKVYKTLAGTTPDDAADILVLTTDYTVTINGDAGGEITLNIGAAVNDKITLVRDLAVTRATEYQQNGDLLATTLNSDQEYQTYLIADTASKDERYISVPNSVQNVSTVLPAPVSDSYFKWNAAANAIENDTTIPAAVTTSAANAAAASANATQAELYEWEAEAERLTADSYATEAEDTPVNVFTSDGDGTFTATPQGGVFSSLHYANKSASFNVDTKLFATAGGTADAIILSIPTILAYSVNSIFMFKATATNTTAATADVNGLGARNIVINGVALVGGEIETGKEYFLRYTGTNFELIELASDNKKLINQSIAVKTDTFSTSVYAPSWIEVTGLSITVTPSSLTSRFIVEASIMGDGGVAGYNYRFKLVRDGTDIEVADTAGNRTSANFGFSSDAVSNLSIKSASGAVQDIPATVSPITYSVYCQVNAAAAGTLYINRNSYDADAVTIARYTSSIKVTELKD